ncbi:hypothetical protein B0H15DRAFT_848014 [Mycena belliarum]|uniref:Uncharacterized protein n=1 Tax=Mycena belliarum TaxID=1033014 RepID=A0AAD6TZE0_9AGAR|nr:hypothetical protein B0H15DRAFT_848014 [Mycena belliae]
MLLPTFSFSSTADEVADALAHEIRGKNVLITGTSLNGVGFDAARAMAKYANLVIITGYNAERLKLSQEAITKDVPSANIRCLSLDLSSFADVRRAAAEVNAYTEPLHVLIHNAAAGIGPLQLTADNLELQAATNHIGPFLLTKLLLEKVLAARAPSYTPRVVFVSALGHIFCDGVNWQTFGRPEQNGYQAFNTYFQTKSANILTAAELTRRAGGRLHAYSVHPGVIYTNMFVKDQSMDYLKAFGILGPDGKPNTEKYEWKTVAQGAATTVAAAFDPRVEDKPGSYLSDCVEANKDVAPHSSDPANAEKLWALTEELIGETFSL